MGKVSSVVFRSPAIMEGPLKAITTLKAASNNMLLVRRVGSGQMTPAVRTV